MPSPSLLGTYTLNSSLSTPYTTPLKLQGVSSLILTALTTANPTIHLTITQPSPNKLSLSQTATAASIPGATEEYDLNDGFKWHEAQDKLFGAIETRARWVSVEEVKAGSVGEGKVGREAGWDFGEGAEGEEELVYAEGRAKDGKWEARHLLGFEAVDGERRHVRWSWVKGREGKEDEVRMVYDRDGE